MKIPNRYLSAIREVYEDSDGIWCLLNDGYVHGVDRTHVIHCETYRELRSEFKEIKRI